MTCVPAEHEIYWAVAKAATSVARSGQSPMSQCGQVIGNRRDSLAAVGIPNLVKLTTLSFLLDRLLSVLFI